jgi:serine/threonine protein kinase
MGDGDRSLILRRPADTCEMLNRSLQLSSATASPTLSSSPPQALLAEGPLDDYSASYIAACCLLGLQHLHQLGVVYRGLSTLTILVTESGIMQLVDFRWVLLA